MYDHQTNGAKPNGIAAAPDRPFQGGPVPPGIGVEESTITAPAAGVLESSAAPHDLAADHQLDLHALALTLRRANVTTLPVKSVQQMLSMRLRGAWMSQIALHSGSRYSDLRRIFDAAAMYEPRYVPTEVPADQMRVLAATIINAGRTRQSVAAATEVFAAAGEGTTVDAASQRTGVSRTAVTRVLVAALAFNNGFSESITDPTNPGGAERFADNRTRSAKPRRESLPIEPEGGLRPTSQPSATSRMQASASKDSPVLEDRTITAYPALVTLVGTMIVVMVAAVLGALTEGVGGALIAWLTAGGVVLVRWLSSRTEIRARLL